MSARTKIMMGVFGAFILVGVAFLYFLNSSTSSSSTTAQNSAAASDAELMFLDLSSQLDSVKFDQTIFTDPRFTALVDIHTPILPETQGRTDPFAPL